MILYFFLSLRAGNCKGVDVTRTEPCSSSSLMFPTRVGRTVSYVMGDPHGRSTAALCGCAQDLMKT